MQPEEATPPGSAQAASGAGTSGTLTATDILQKVGGANNEVKLELTPTQKAGFRLAAGVGALAFVAVLFVGAD